MKHALLSLLFLCTFFASARALDKPLNDGETWYFIQFVSGGNVIADQGAGTEVRTATITMSAAKLWRVAGSEEEGYSFVNKLGNKLYVTSATQNTGFLATAASPEAGSAFSLVENAAGTAFLIAPKDNSGVYLNQWQGAGTGKRIGLWNDKTDSGSMLVFVDAAEYQAVAPLPLIPYPTSLVRGEGTLSLSALSGISCDGEWLALAQDFSATLAVTSGIELPCTSEGGGEGKMLFVKDPTLPAEGYTLEVTAEGVAVKASTRAGLFYALQTIKQLLPVAIYGNALDAEARWSLPVLTIADEPRFAHRGFMADVSRHFFTKEEIKCVIDIMATYKLNRLHIHLTDDQGWRIQIPEYSKLTEVGAIRSASNTSAGLSTTFYDDTEYGRGCFFTLDDLREIVAYASEHCVEIMPEIDMPGHMVAALASYPELSCNPSKKYEVRVDGGISTDVLDISNPEVITFLKTVLGHVAEVFPYEYIHIGGDECPTTCWEASSACKAFAAEKGISISEMQGWLVEELGEWLRDNYGKGIVVWDELLSHWPSTNAIKPVVMAWNNIGKTSAAADMGLKSIACPYQSVYLDFMQAAPANCYIDEEYFGGWSETNTNTLSDVYNLNPASSLSGREEYVLGAQGNLWAETLCNFRQLQAQMLPRMIALAEVGWLPNSQKNYTDFCARLQSHDELLDAAGWIYSRHGFESDLQSAHQTNLAEADRLLNATRPDEAGYATQQACDQLASWADGVNEAEAEEALAAALATFKASSIVPPSADRLYQIESASSYYKAKYDGSTIYARNGEVRFHYTPQLEPEEIWQFEANDEGWTLKNALTDKYLSLPTYNANAVISDTPTSLRIDRATVQPDGGYDYLPGVVNISAVSGYTAESSGSVARLYADATGYVKSYDDPTLYKQGTWRLREIADYLLMLQKLIDKCQLIVIKGADAYKGVPSDEALCYLQDKLIEPASQLTECDAETYADYMAVYKAYLDMPRLSYLSQLSENVYYRIRNAYSGWSNRYAALGSDGSVVPTTSTAGDASLWRIVKNDDQTAYLYNKSNDRAAYVASATQDAKVKTGDTPTAWMLEEFASDESEGILIRTGNYSWYTNPNAWSYLLLKPYQWGACVWSFEATSTEVPDGIAKPAAAPYIAKAYRDLQGRPLTRGYRGVAISDNGQKVIVR